MTFRKSTAPGARRAAPASEAERQARSKSASSPDAAAASRICSAGSPSDCQGSELCKQNGMCDAHKGSCVNLPPHFDAECGSKCRSDGRCVELNKECSALSKNHCYGSAEDKPDPESICAMHGRCSVDKGECVAGSEDDCKQAKDCQKEQKCAVVGGRRHDTSRLPWWAAGVTLFAFLATRRRGRS